MNALPLSCLLALSAVATAGTTDSPSIQSLELKERQLKVQLAQVAADLAAAQRQLAAPERPLPLSQTLGPALASATLSPTAPMDLPEASGNTPAHPYFPELLGDPAYARSVQVIETQRVWANHGPLIRELATTPPAMETAADLLTQEALIDQDLEGIAPGGESGVKGQARVKLVRAWRKNIAAAFGPDAVTKERAFNGSMRIRETLDSLQTRLSYTAQPLTDDQYSKLLVLIQAKLGPKVGSRYWLFSDDLVTAAASVLSADQMGALREVADERNALSATRRS